MRSPQQRRRTAFHEAAHAVVANLLGLRVGVVSARPSKNHLGVTFAGGGLKLLESEREKIMRPGAAAPGAVPQIGRDAGHGLLGRRLRRAYSMSDRSGYVDETHELEAERLAAMIASALKPSELSEIERRLLAAAETGPPPTRDEDAALGLAMVTTDDATEARALVAYLRVVTAQMVFSEPAASRIRTFAETLLTHEVLSARRARRVLQGEFTAAAQPR